MFPMTIYCWDPGEDWNFRLAPGGSHRADVQRFKSWGGDRPRQCLTIGTMVEGKGWWYVDVRGCSWRLMNAFAIVDPMKRGKNMEKYGTIWINMDKYGKIWNNMENAWCSGSPLNMERFFFLCSDQLHWSRACYDILSSTLCTPFGAVSVSGRTTTSWTNWMNAFQRRIPWVETLLGLSERRGSHRGPDHPGISWGSVKYRSELLLKKHLFHESKLNSYTSSCITC